MTVLRTGLASTAPVSFAPAADGKVYGVNGVTRGFVVVGGTTAYPIGVTAAPTVAAASVTSPQYYYVSSIEVLSGGENYNAPPEVTISGVSGAQAYLVGDAVGSITITSSATTHTFAPPVNLSASQANNAAVTARVRGSVTAVRVAGGGLWADPPDITFTAATGVTTIRAAQGRGVRRFPKPGLAGLSRLTSVIIEDPGVYEWDGLSLSESQSPVVATAVGTQAGTAALTLTPRVSGVVTSIAVSTGGSQYTAAPSIEFLPRGPLREGSGAAGLASLDGTSAISTAQLLTGGNGYSGRVEVTLSSQRAAAVAVLQPRLAGKYLLGWRYVANDGTPGDLCPLVLVDCGEKASSLAWNLTGIGMTDGSPSRVSRLELWRTSSNQAITLYRVASLTAAQVTALGPSNLFTEGLTDAELTDIARNTTLSGVESIYQELPILTEDGLPSAYRFGVPPATMSVVTLYGDRAWYAADSTAAEPNTIYFSGVQEYDSVPAENQIVLQNLGREAEAIAGLMVLGGALYVGLRRSMVRLTVGDQPLLSASAAPVAQRGMLNDRCWDQLDGVAYIVDSDGLYAFDGNGVDPLSDPVSTYWTAPTVDFSKATYFFVRADASERVVRFYFSAIGQSGDYPKSALCFSLITKAWWVEEYASPVSCGVRARRQGRQAELVGSTDSVLQTGSGLTDAGTAIPYSLKTGNLPLTAEQNREIRALYTPTATDNTLKASLYYNGSATPRPFAIASNSGTGFVTATGSTQATLNMNAARSPLGTATGMVSLPLSGRMDERSAGGDRHVALELSGGQSDSKPVIHRLEIHGAG